MVQYRPNSTMEYMYAALLLHKLKQDINEDNVRNVIKATGVVPDDLKSSPVSVPGPAIPLASSSPQPTESKEQEKKEEKKEEEALEGLSALFG